jgi:adenylylsulfate kinase
VYVKATLNTCRARDPKGLYARAGAGQIQQFTGISASYEEPLSPDLTLDTDCLSVTETAQIILEHLQSAGLIDSRDGAAA